MDVLPSANLSMLIGAIYDCALAPSLWRETLRDIALACNAHGAIFSLNDLMRDRVLIHNSFGWEQGWLDRRTKYLPEIQQMLDEWSASHPQEGSPFVMSREISQHNLEVSPYVVEFLRPLGVADVVHYFLIQDEGYFSELVLSFSAARGIVSDDQLALGALLLPHLRRAVTINNMLDARTIGQARLVEALDGLNCSVILTDKDATILHANRAAEIMLHGDGVLKKSDGMLHVCSESANQELRKAIALGAGNVASLGSAGIAVRLTEKNAAPVFAHVLPLTVSQLRSAVQPAVAAVFVGGRLSEQCDIDVFVEAFDLTVSEAKVVCYLLKGFTLSEAADELGIARSTIKSHLDKVFQKTGTTRQADLIRVAMHTVAPI